MSGSVWQPGSTITPTVNAAMSLVPQVYIATAGQTVFTTTKFLYQPNSGSLLVSINGLDQTIGQPGDSTVAVQETDQATFTLTSPCEAGDIVVAKGFVGAASAGGAVVAAQQANASAAAAAASAVIAQNSVSNIQAAIDAAAAANAAAAACNAAAANAANAVVTPIANCNAATAAANTATANTTAAINAATTATTNANAAAAAAAAAVQGCAPNLFIVSGTSIQTSAGGQYVLENVASSTAILPANPAASATVYITVANGRVDNVVSRNGANIMGLAEDFTLDVQGITTYALRYTDTTNGWVWL